MRTGELYQRYHGIYVGNVVSVEDPEGLGRIRLKCDQYEDSDDDPLWAVVARPGGGETSIFFTPNIGDQVIFGFQVGDVNGPVVLGYAHNSGDNKPPAQVDAKTKKHGVVTKIGSVVFDEDAKKIVVTFGSDEATITMNADGITVAAKQVVLKSDKVLIGSADASDRIPLWSKLMDWLNNHTHPTAMGPTSTPVPPATIDIGTSVHRIDK